MRCSTCGEELQPGATRCPTCGAFTAVSQTLMRPAGVRRCPRCGYQGEGIPYFRRAGHVGLLVGVTVFTLGIGGLGGLVYWLARRRHLVCPRCGFGWKHASRALALTGLEPERGIVEEREAEQLPSGGVVRRTFGVLLILVAAFLVVLGVSRPEVAVIAVGGLLGAGGSLGFYWGWHAQQDRRRAIVRGLQHKILQLATAKGGTLTVTEVATELDLSMSAAEKILTSMDDGFRVRSEISKEGILYYEFPEVRHRDELGSGR